MLSATTETLRLIGAHPGDLTKVLHGILAKAAELCGGEAGSISLNEGGAIRVVASHGPAMEPYVGTTVPAVAEDQALFSGTLHTHRRRLGQPPRRSVPRLPPTAYDRRRGGMPPDAA
jgi:hypothetical protein